MSSDGAAVFGRVMERHDGAADNRPNLVKRLDGDTHIPAGVLVPAGHGPVQRVDHDEGGLTGDQFVDELVDLTSVKEVDGLGEEEEVLTGMATVFLPRLLPELHPRGALPGHVERSALLDRSAVPRDSGGNGQ